MLEKEQRSFNLDADKVNVKAVTGGIIVELKVKR
jgi:hypothetical protein